MTSPTIVLDFTTRTVAVVGVDPGAERKLQETIAAQREVNATSGGTPPEAPSH